MDVAVVLFDGFDELDAIGPWEVLANAAQLGADVRVRLVTVDPVAEVRGSHGLRVVPDGVLGDVDVDVVVVPGGGWNDRSETGAWGEAQRGRLPAALAELHRQGSTVASVCTGAMLLAAAGLTRGRPATTHHLALDELRHHGTAAVEARVVDDGDVVTAGGVTAGIDLALWLVERHWGRELARRVSAEMEYEGRGQVVRGR